MTPSGEPLLLHPTEDTFREVVNQIADRAIFMLDIEGRVASWNEGAQKIHGYLAEEIIGRHVLTFYRAEDALKWPQAVEVVLRSGRLENEGWRVRKGGSSFWAHVVTTALRNSRRSLLGFAKIVCDLTELRRAEEAVRQHDAHYRAFVADVADHATFMLDAAGDVVTWNVGAQRMTGYCDDEIVGRPFTHLYSEEDVRVGKCRQWLARASTAGRCEDESWQVRRGGARFRVRTVLVAHRAEEGQLGGFTVVARDLTDRRRADD